jgi:hypothetical protein
MNPSTWIALAGLASAMFIQAIVFSFALGRLFQDVASLKSVGAERAVQGLAIARLEVQLGHVSSQVSDLKSTFEDRTAFLQTPPIYQPQKPRRRRASPLAE